MVFVHRLHCFNYALSVCYLLALAVLSMGKSWFIIRQWLLPQYCGTKGPIGYFHQTNQNSGFQTVAATLEMLLPPNQSASV